MISVTLAPCGGSGSAALGQFEGITLEGRVRTNQGQSVAGGAIVHLQTAGAMDAGQQFTASDGGFSFPNIAKTVYVVTVTAKGFESYQTTLDLSKSSSEYFLNVFLVPAGEAVQNPAALMSRSDQQAPKKARKENQKGVRALGQKNFAAARAHFEKALSIDRCYARAQANLAVVLEQQHQMESAIVLLRKSLKCDPEYLDSYIELGQFLDAQGKFSEGQAVLEEGVRRSPSTWQFYYELGLAEFRRGDYERAEASFNKVKFFNHSPPAELYVKLADLYVKERAFPKAYGAMQEYLRAAPKGRYAARVKSIMQQMETAGVVARSQ